MSGTRLRRQSGGGGGTASGSARAPGSSDHNVSLPRTSWQAAHAARSNDGAASHRLSAWRCRVELTAAWETCQSRKCIHRCLPKGRGALAAPDELPAFATELCTRSLFTNRAGRTWEGYLKPQLQACSLLPLAASCPALHSDCCCPLCRARMGLRAA